MHIFFMASSLLILLLVGLVGCVFWLGGEGSARGKESAEE